MKVVIIAPDSTINWKDHYCSIEDYIRYLLKAIRRNNKTELDKTVSFKLTYTTEIEDRIFGKIIIRPEIISIKFHHAESLEFLREVFYTKLLQEKIKDKESLPKEDI